MTLRRQMRVIIGVVSLVITVVVAHPMAVIAIEPALQLAQATTRSQAPISTPNQTQKAPNATKSQRQIGGVSVSPAFQNVTVSDAKPTDTYQFSLTNNTSEPLEFSLSAVDFGSLDESGGVLFLGSTEKSLNYRYGLVRYVTLERDRLTVESKKTEKVRLTITNKESLTPGGHYGAILATPVNTGNTSKVQVNQVVSSLLFLNKQGGESYRLNLRDYSIETHLFKPPDAVKLRFQNAGNVHVIPRGIITITDPRGREVSRGFINGGSAIVLPETFRRLTVPLEQMSTAWLPGKYQMTVAYRYDGSQSLQTAKLEFFYLNGWYVVIGLLNAAFLVLLAVNRRIRRTVWRGLRWPFARLKKFIQIIIQKYRRKH